MNEIQVIAILATLFVLRFIVPLAISLGVCQGMCRLVERRQA